MGVFVKKYGHLNILVLLFCIMTVDTIGQESPNPFELIHRLDQTTQQAITSPEENPFNIVAPTETLTIDLERSTNNSGTLIMLYRFQGDNKVPQSWIILLFFPLVFMLTITVSLFREKIRLMYKSFFNSNMLNLAFREYDGRTNIHQLFLYILSVISFAIFGFIFFQKDYINTENFGQAVTLSFLITFLYITIKYCAIAFIKNIFPQQKTLSFYLFSFSQYNFSLAIGLIPFSIFLAFSPDFSAIIIRYMAYLFIGFWWIIRIFKGLQISTKFISLNIFRFFAYICTVEIAPVLILLTTVRFILDF